MAEARAKILRMRVVIRIQEVDIGKLIFLVQTFRKALLNLLSAKLDSGRKFGWKL